VSDNPFGLKLNRFTARVRDIERATAWYRDILGFRVGETGTMLDGAMQYAYLHWPDFGVSLVQLNLPATEVALGEQVLPCWQHPVFEATDPHSLYQELKERGVDVFTHAPEVPERVTSFLFHDSEGNEIEIVSEGGGH